MRREFVEEIARAIHAVNTPFLRAVVAELHEADLGDLIEALEADDRVSLVELTGADFDFSALNEVDGAVREEILEELEPETVAEGVRELECAVPSNCSRRSTKKSRTKSSKSYRRPSATRSSAASNIRKIPPAGGCRPNSSRCRRLDRRAGDRLHARHRRTCPTASTKFAVDKAQHWHGAVALDALLRSRRLVPLAELIDEDRRRVSVMDDQEEVARLFGKYNLVAAPVVDTADRLVGVITIDDVVDVIEEEADEDLKALGGVTSDEALSDSVWTIAKGRFNWLLVDLATAFLASSVLGLFEGQLEKWWRWRCWRRSSPARAATPRPRP